MQIRSLAFLSPILLLLLDWENAGFTQSEVEKNRGKLGFYFNSKLYSLDRENEASLSAEDLTLDFTKSLLKEQVNYYEKVGLATETFALNLSGISFIREEKGASLYSVIESVRNIAHQEKIFSLYPHPRPQPKVAAFGVRSIDTEQYILDIQSKQYTLDIQSTSRLVYDEPDENLVQYPDLLMRRQESTIPRYQRKIEYLKRNDSLLYNSFIQNSTSFLDIEDLDFKEPSNLDYYAIPFDVRSHTSWKKNKCIQCKMSEQDFSDAPSMSLVDFSESDFYKSNLSGVDFLDSNFNQASFMKANLSNSRIRNSDFSLANLSHANIDYSHISGGDFNRAILNSVTFTSTKIENVDFSGIDLSYSNFEEADLKNVNLSRSILVNSNFNNAKLSNVKLTGVDLSSANFTRAALAGADLSGSDLSNANLTNADFQKANLSGANLSGSTLANTKLADANLSGANLSGVILDGADLSNADLSGSDLRGAVVDASIADATSVSGAIVDNNTKLPKNIDVKEYDLVVNNVSSYYSRAYEQYIDSNVLIDGYINYGQSYGDFVPRPLVPGTAHVSEKKSIFSFLLFSLVFIFLKKSKKNR